MAAYAVTLRFWLAWNLPLWLDESWTAVISKASSLADFTHQAWLDSNAPLYYFLMWLWPFESDFGLKLPSLIFVIAAPTLAVLCRRGRISLMWAVLLLLWMPSIHFSVDARGYSLLLLLSVLQTVAFVRVLERPSTGRAAAWVGLSSLAILTHYYAAIPALIEGLVYLWMHRKRALRTWPALFLLAPAVGWFAYHVPRLLLYAEDPWYERVGLRDWPRMLLWPLGGGALVCAFGILVITGLFLRRPPRVILATAGAGWIAAALLVGVGLLRPMLVDRYLLPCVPPILLGLAASVRFNGYLPLAGWLALNIGSPVSLRSGLEDRAWFGLELPARELPDARVVSWQMDYPGSVILDEEKMKSLLSDAFARNGRTVTARWDGNLLAGDGLIWLYGKSSEAKANAIRRTWRCKTHRGDASTLICQRH